MNANLVLQPERRPPRSDEPSGMAVGFDGPLTGFGTKHQQTKPQQLKEKIDQIRKKREQRKKKERELSIRFGGNIISLEKDVTIYYPKTRETEIEYEKMLAIISKHLTDVPDDVIKRSAHDILLILKNPEFAELQRKNGLNELIPDFSDEEIGLLTSISKNLIDFTFEEQVYKKDDQIDTIGVPLEISDSSEDENVDLNDEIISSEEERDSDIDGEDTFLDPLAQKRKDIEDDEFFQDYERDDPLKVSALEIDAFWLLRKLKTFFSDDVIAQQISEEVFKILNDINYDNRECENKLVSLLDFERFEFIKILLKNRFKIIVCILLARTKDEEQRQILKTELSQKKEFSEALVEIERDVSLTSNTNETTSNELNRITSRMDLVQSEKGVYGRTFLDLQNLVFEQGSHFMANSECTLPPNSTREKKKGYEEIFIRPPLNNQRKDAKIIYIKDLPEFARLPFEKLKHLNPVQSVVYHQALFQPDNLLICAPTGSGKTNIAMLTILREIGLHTNHETKEIDYDSFKIIYIAPMKSLVQEVVGSFSNRLKGYGIQVRELSGDQQLSKQQISETQLIVTTPEKWDIITRKSGERAYTQIVRLIIIDEIHLLHDDRGPVLEAIVSRTIQQVESTQEMIRIVGLSATLPNYKDVASFLRVDPEKGLFHFDNSQRPCPLYQRYIGITEKNALKRYNLMNQIVYEKVIERASSDHQILIFVHSRKETAKTIRALLDLVIENNMITKFIGRDRVTKEILKTESQNCKDPDLKSFLPNGFAIHHAGLTKTDRSLVEDLFSDRQIKVLCSTATLAWGVNLPARTVIIKGTQYYNPEKGAWVELSMLDVMQQMGRAGRPQFDKEGEGIIITSHQELQFYLSLFNHQLPIESQLISRIVDCLNAEIVLGTINNIDDGVEWLGNSYLYIRMLQNPKLYGIPDDEISSDPKLLQRRIDLIHTSATILDKNKLVKYDRRTGAFHSTVLGRVASYYYITHNSIAVYNEFLKPYMTKIELFRLFTLSSEFKNVIVRSEEKIELQKLLERVPIPVKETTEDPSAKINVLLQSYISRLKLDGFSLLSDMVYITQSALRIFRALFEIAVRRGWAELSRIALETCKMVDKRMWISQSPLRQFSKLPAEVIKRIEKNELSWESMLLLDSREIGKMLRFEKMGKILHKLIHQIPRVFLESNVQPITHNLIYVELSITPDFKFADSKDPNYSGSSEPFWIFVFDADGEHLLHYEYFLLKKRFANREHVVNFMVPIEQPLPPQYFIFMDSDRWIGSNTTLPISFRNLILPQKPSAFTELLDLQPLPVEGIRGPNLGGDEKEMEMEGNEKNLKKNLKQNFNFKKFFAQFSHFNPIQTQTFNTLFNTDSNTLIAAPPGSGKTICAEFAVLRTLLNTRGKGKCVYIAPFKSLVDERFADWARRFSEVHNSVVARLTGELSADLKLMEKSQLVLATPGQFDTVSRRWKTRRSIKKIDLFIADELHLLGSENGAVMEVVVSRMRCMGAQTQRALRVVGLSAAVENARDMGEWLDVPRSAMFCFRPDVRPVPLEIHIQGFDIPHFSPRMSAMLRPSFRAIIAHCVGDSQQIVRPAIVFAPSATYAKTIALDYASLSIGEKESNKFILSKISELTEGILDENLSTCLNAGIGYIYSGMENQYRKHVENLFRAEKIRLIVVDQALCWDINLSSYLVVIYGAQRWDARDQAHVDLNISTVAQMTGRACRPLVDSESKCILMCHTAKKNYFKTFLHDAFPIESHLDHFLPDFLNAEIVSKTVENHQEAVDFLTWTFYYNRLTKNPNYYSLRQLSPQSISDHLSELIERALNDLETAHCIRIEPEMGIYPLNLGMVAAYYNTKYTTIELFANSITNTSRLKGILEILSASTEFDDFPVRHKEHKLLRTLARHVPITVVDPNDTANLSDSHTKTNLLLQSHFARIPLPPILQHDLDQILVIATRLLHAMVNVISTLGFLKPALTAMELCQMCVQALFATDSVLKQLPHISDSLVSRCNSQSIQTVFDLLDMEDDSRSDLLQLPQHQMNSLALACNRYPSIFLEFSLSSKNVPVSHPINIDVKLERDIDDDDQLSFVFAPFYPENKSENWWLVVANPHQDSLLSIKSVNILRSNNVSLEFPAPQIPGSYHLVLYLMCDSYIGCDQEYPFEIVVDSDDDNDNNDDNDNDNQGKDNQGKDNQGKDNQGKDNQGKDMDEDLKN
ncbi:u5 small nuclear ribonucleoprotein helicase [Anaeramoeba ignava]|uniref:RNA helicase n=1 Tax=Anaeramoeba ignava TaxID=1746090 RepID=A0A9Q0LT09_ANAIG|nr:u5 small nuclear ribonucleoprotein helicase [Anaeramoeba ignava]